MLPCNIVQQSTWTGYNIFTPDTKKWKHKYKNQFVLYITLNWLIYTKQN